MEDNDMLYIQRDDPNHEYLSESLANKIDKMGNIAQILQVVSFTNYLLIRYGGIVKGLQNFINAVISKLESLTSTLGEAYLHIEASIDVHLSITFQVNAIQTK